MKNWTKYLKMFLKKCEKFSKFLALKGIRGYQLFLGPLLLPQCRFYPTCSHYAQEAFQQYSVLQATRFVFFRLISCHPFGRSGYDPVPARKQNE